MTVSSQVLNPLPQVGTSSFCDFNIIVPQPDDAVTGITEKSSDSSSLMAMVNTNPLYNAATYCASTVLRLQERIKLALCDPVTLESMIGRLAILSPPARLAIPGFSVEVAKSVANSATTDWFRLYEWKPCQSAAFRAWLPSSGFVAFGFVEILKWLFRLTLRADHKVLYHAVC